jgi:hypothetical protein
MPSHADDNHPVASFVTPPRPSLLRLSVAPVLALLAAGAIGLSGLVLPLPDGAERGAAWLVPGASDAAGQLDERAARRTAPRRARMPRALPGPASPEPERKAGQR